MTLIAPTSAVLATTYLQGAQAFSTFLNSPQAATFATDSIEIQYLGTAVGGVAFQLPQPKREEEDVGKKLLSEYRTLRAFRELNQLSPQGPKESCLYQLRTIADTSAQIPPDHFARAAAVVMGALVFVNSAAREERSPLQSIEFFEILALNPHSPYARVGVFKLIEEVEKNPADVELVERVRGILQKVMEMRYEIAQGVVDQFDHALFNLLRLENLMDVYERLAASPEVARYENALGFLHFLIGILPLNFDASGMSPELKERWGRICPAADFEVYGFGENPSPA